MAVKRGDQAVVVYHSEVELHGVATEAISSTNLELTALSKHASLSLATIMVEPLFAMERVATLRLTLPKKKTSCEYVEALVSMFSRVEELKLSNFGGEELRLLNYGVKVLDILESPAIGRVVCGEKRAPCVVGRVRVE